MNYKVIADSVKKRKLIRKKVTLTLLVVWFHMTAVFLFSQNSVKIGNQIWMNTNLNVSIFRNGDIIKEVKSEEDWDQANKTKQPAWCYFNNDPSNGAKYGKLYNWWAVNDSRGLAPEGWHIPGVNEVNELYKFAGGFDIGGNKLKTNSGWNNYTKEIICPTCNNESYSCSKCEGRGKIIKTYNGNGTNDFGFSSLPGGYRAGYCCHANNGYFSLGEYAKYWTYGGFSLSRDGFFNTNEDPSYGEGRSVRCIKDSKEYTEKISIENQKKDEKNRIKNFEKEFENLVNIGTTEENFKYIEENKAAIFAILDNNNVQINRIAKIVHGILISVEKALINSIDEDDNFEYTKSFFKLFDSQDFRDYENKINNLGSHRYDYSLSKSFEELKKEVSKIDEFISFKAKIKKIRKKELSELEKQIVGQWDLYSSNGAKTIIILKDNREIEISDFTIVSGKRKIGIKSSKNGIWEYDGGNLIFYPEWDVKVGVYSKSKISDKKRKYLKESLEPKFLIGDNFSIKHFKEASEFVKDIILDLDPILNEWGKNEAGYSEIQKHFNELVISLKDLNFLMKDETINQISPLDGKKVRMDLPDIKQKVENMRKNYIQDFKSVENFEKFISEDVMNYIDLEKLHSMNLDKRTLVKYKFRIEGENAILELGELIQGKRIK